MVDRTPDDTLAEWIREALIEMGGIGKCESVLDVIERKHCHELTHQDMSGCESNGEPAWRASAKWHKFHMKGRGYLRDNNGRWELTERGRVGPLHLTLEELEELL